MKKTVTKRNFYKGEFTDSYQQTCSIQNSSLATEDCIWLGVNSADPKIMASKAAEHGIKTNETTGWVDYPIPEDVLLSTRMHLTRDMAKELIPLLQNFVATGNIYG